MSQPRSTHSSPGATSLMDHDDVVETSDSDERELSLSEQVYLSPLIVNKVDASGVSTPCPVPQGDWYPSPHLDLRDKRHVEEPPRKRIKVSLSPFVRFNVLNSGTYDSWGITPPCQGCLSIWSLLPLPNLLLPNYSALYVHQIMIFSVHLRVRFLPIAVFHQSQAQLQEWIVMKSFPVGTRIGTIHRTNCYFSPNPKGRICVSLLAVRDCLRILHRPHPRGSNLPTTWVRT
jgi:hypothetical protein